MYIQTKRGLIVMHENAVVKEKPRPEMGGGEC